MIHKKSEYSLNYHILQKDMNERRQIWQNNIKCRESLRSLNRADHYWSFQLSDNCTCENDAEEDEVDNLVPHKAKHKALLAKYSSNQPTKIEGLLWSSNGNTIEKTHQPVATDGETNQTPVKPIPRRGQEIGVQTPNWHADDPATDSIRELKELDRDMGLNTLSDKVTPNHPKALPPNSTPLQTGRPLTVADLIPDGPVTPNSRCLAASRLARSAGSSRSRSVLTRTSRRAFFSDKVAPFASYGWNNDVKTMGEKKTYNINAPDGEVYKNAVHTQRRRRDEVERYLQEEASRKELKGTRSRSVVNHSSIWRSEYQDRFAAERSSKQSGNCLRARSVSAVRPNSSSEWYRGNG